MRKRIVLSVIVLAIAGACAAILWSRAGPSPILSLQTPSAGATARGWPADQHWSWTFPLPDRSARDQIGLRLRQKAMPLPRGAMITSFENAMRPTEAEHSFDTGKLGTSGARTETSGLASVQLIDLAEIGAASTEPGKSLRVLAKFSVGGTELELTSDKTILPAGRFAGRTVRNEGAWADGELYLMSFWIESEVGLTRYDVLLEQSAVRPAH